MAEIGWGVERWGLDTWGSTESGDESVEYVVRDNSLLSPGVYFFEVDPNR